MKDILHEMNAFLEGRENRFLSVLSSASTGQLDELNQHLQAIIGPPGNLCDAVARPGSTQAPGPQASPGRQGDAGHPEVFGPASGEIGLTCMQSARDWSALSWSDLVALKAQIDQQLNTVRTEFQTFFGPLSDDMVAEAAAELDRLPITELAAGARDHTNSLMAQLSAQQGSESSLVDDVLASISHRMDADSLVTTDDPREGLAPAFYPGDGADHSALATRAPAARSAPQSYEDAESSGDRPTTPYVPVDQARSMDSVSEPGPGGKPEV